MIKYCLTALVCLVALTPSAQIAIPQSEVVVHPFDTASLAEYRELDAYQYGSIEGESVWEIIKRRINEKLRQWFNGDSVTYNIAVIVGALAVLIVLVVLLLNVKSGVIAAGDNRDKDKIGLFDEEVRIATLPERIANCEAEDDMAGAFRFRFLLLLSELDRAEVIKARKYKTNGEYRTEVNESQPEHTSLFNDLADIFDQVFYGGKNIDRGVYQGTLRLFDQMTQGVAS